jgi:hypothetical protein
MMTELYDFMNGYQHAQALVPNYPISCNSCKDHVQEVAFKQGSTRCHVWELILDCLDPPLAGPSSSPLVTHGHHASVNEVALLTSGIAGLLGGSTTPAPISSEYVSWNLTTPITSMKSGKQRVVPLVSSASAAIAITNESELTRQSSTVTRRTHEDVGDDCNNHDDVAYAEKDWASGLLLRPASAASAVPALRPHQHEALVAFAKIQNVKAINALFRPASGSHHQQVTRS